MSSKRKRSVSGISESICLKKLDSEIELWGCAVVEK